MEIARSLLVNLALLLDRIVKSGTDFNDLSEVILELEDAPANSNSVRKKLVKSLKGESAPKQHTVCLTALFLVVRHSTNDEGSLKSVKDIIKDCRKDLEENFETPFCKLSGDLDVTASVIRGGEVSVYS